MDKLIITAMICGSSVACIGMICLLFYQPVKLQKRRIELESNEQAFRLMQQKEIFYLKLQKGLLEIEEAEPAKAEPIRGEVVHYKGYPSKAV